MDDSERIRQFWNRWEHQPNTNEHFVRFKNRMLEVAHSMWLDYFTKAESLQKELALVSGTLRSPYPGWEYSGFYSLLNKAKNEFEVADALRCLLRSVENSGAFDVCCRRIQKALDLSPGIMMQLVRHGQTAILFPTGVRLLDEGVVEANVSWLALYPNVSKAFEEALRLYATKDPNQYRGMLDNLRFALEQMVGAVLKNDKSLENQKGEFLAWLKKLDAHTHIRNMYHDLLFDHFTRYQNAAVKHEEDKYTPAEVEFMLYATGTFLRFIQRLLDQQVQPTNGETDSAT